MTRNCPCDDPLCKYNIVPPPGLKTEKVALWILLDVSEAPSETNYKVLIAKEPDGTKVLYTKTPAHLNAVEAHTLSEALSDPNRTEAVKLKIAREALQTIATARHGYPTDAPHDSAILAEKTLAKIA